MNSKWLMVLLIVSLALNFALLGFVIGKGFADRGGPDPSKMYRRWVHTLPEPRRDELRPGLRESFVEQRPLVRTMRRQHRALREQIRAETFSAEDMSATLAAMRDTHNRLQALNNASFVDFVGALTPAERTALADDLRKLRPRHQRPHREQKPYPKQE